LPSLEDFASDLYDPSVASALHAGDDPLQDQQRRLHKKFQLVQVSFPGLLFDGQEGLRTGGIDHRDIDVLIGLIDCADHALDIRFQAHIGIEGSGFPALLLDLFAQLLGAVSLGEVIDRNLCASCGQFQSNCRAQPARGAGNQRSSSLERFHDSREVLEFKQNCHPDRSEA
jgi:hypothetical protein